MNTTKNAARAHGKLRPVLAAALAVFPLASSTLHAVDATWTGANNGNWSDGTNWSGGVPGSVSGVDTSVATFDNNTNTTITYPGGNWVVSGITFTGPSAGAFTIGTNANVLNLATTGGGAATIQTTADVVNAQTFAAPITLRGTSTFTFLSNATSAAATLTFNGNISMSSAFGLTLDGSNSGSNTINGVIGGAGNLRKQGTGLWTLTNASSSYTGATTITGGVLSVSKLADGGVVSSIGASSSASSNLVLAGGALRYTGTAQSTDRLFNLAVSVSTLDASGSGALNFTNTGSIGMHAQNGNRTLVLTGTNTGANTLAASIGQQGGTTSVTKNGGGNWILSGVSTYSGNTTINAGTLLVNNAVSGSDSGTGASSVIVSALGTLGGIGQITPGTDASISVANGGKIAPGTGGIGALTINGANTTAPVLSMASGAKFVFELNTGFESDRLILLNGATGDFAFNGNAIDFSDLSGGSLEHGAYILFTATAADNFGGAFATDGNGYITAGLSIGTGLEAYAGSTLQLVGNNIVLNVVPEPSSVALLTAAGTVILAARRRGKGQPNS
jgi:fibronectin-binding autotransporter adhesin